TLSLPALPRSLRRPCALPGAFGAFSGARAGLPAVDLTGLETGGARPLDWMERRAAGAQSAIHRQSQPLPDTALGAGEGLGEQDSVALCPPTAGRLGKALWLPAPV